MTKHDALVDGFLSKAAEFTEQELADEVLEGIAAGSALGAGFGAILPLLLKRFVRPPSVLLNSPAMARAGALGGGALGSFAGRWLPHALRTGQEGYRTEANNFPQTKTKKSADEALKGVGLGGLVGGAISAGSSLPILLGRLGRRLPTRVLNKMLLGRALSGAAIGAAVGGIVSKSKPNVYHYYYHKSLKEKGLGE